MSLWWLLAYRPFLDPIPVGDAWPWLAVPLVIGIAIAYKALKLRHLEDLPRESAKLAATIFVFLIASAILLYVVTGWF